jgi:hypothetical protein
MILIVAGTSRSGKSTVTRRICRQTGFSHFPMDAIISTLENLYPETGISHHDDNTAFSPVLAAFTAEFISHLRYEELDAVLDLYQLFPSDFVRFVQADDIKAVYLGYPDLLPEQKLAAVKSSQRGCDWTRQISDEEMLVIISRFIEEGIRMRDECRIYGIPFFDTGSNFPEAVGRAVSCALNLIEAGRG